MIEGNCDRNDPATARRQLYAACLLTLTTFGGAGTVHAQSNEAPRAYVIDAGSLENALNQLSRQSQVQIVFPPELMAGKRARALSGRLTWRDALERLLQGSGLEYRQVADKTIVIRKSEASAAPPEAPPAKAPKPAPSAGRDGPVTDVEGMTVTGTRIRGGITPSPVITIDAENIREAGFANLGEVVRSVPQNFSGGQNPEVPSGNLLGAGVANQNVTGGSGLNLRGLGPDATLTLLNGRRMSYNGFSQALDISAIPVEAVDRVEIVPDGASAIYGSDAVGGVGNVVLRRDFEGVTLSTRYGGATDGGLTTNEYTATAGLNWSGGGLIAAYQGVSADPIHASQRDYTRYLPNPTTIYPSNDLRSGLVSVHQSVGDSIELQLDALRSTREQANSFFLSRLPQYYRIMPETTTTWVSPSVEFYLPKEWTLSVGATWGEDESVYRQSLIDIPTGISSRLYHNCFCNELRAYEVGAEGPWFDLPGGDARLAVGIGYRANEFRQIVEVGAGLEDLQGKESSRFVYAEINLPLIGTESKVAGVNRLAITAAVRSEDYDSFGRVTTPQFGLIYSPSNDFSVKGSWGKSFKAPTLYQNYNSVTAVLYPAAVLGGAGYSADATAMLLQGGERDLMPERARTWTASLAFHPEALPNLQVELTRFDIDYTDRVMQPISNATQGLSNPIYAPFVEHSPTAQSQAEVLAEASFLNATGATYDPDKVVAILHGRYVNVSRQRVKGIDLSGSYRVDLDAGRLTIRGSASRLDSSQLLGPGLKSVDLAGTLFNPAKVNARLGLIWSQNSFTLSTFANYTGGVTDTVKGEKGGSFTTFDMTLRYAVDRQDGVGSGWEFALVAQNLLDREPPFRSPTSLIYSTPYDPTNYSAIGRFLSLSVSKHW